MQCPQCHAEMPPMVAACPQCGRPNDTPIATQPGQPPMPPPGQYPPGSGASIGDDPAMRMLLPVGLSPYAIVAGYLGLFSLICLPAPLAIIFGWLALRDIKKNPRLHGKGRAWFGIIMGVIFTILMFVGPFLASM